ncbi:MAG: PEGA domain-containing protein [Candidatus Andersenbacteria bacterium]|nr:PEGA domain-containing protein [Candidatus Andersenbacteria bacterium]
MHLNIRRLLSIVAFIAFIAIAPVIVLYAIGYRSVSTSLPEPVGVAIINALPKKAVVSINGTAYGTVPRSVPNLLPGTVEVQVAKDGYQPWQKKLEIKPMQATDARNIKLIPTTQDTDELTADATAFATSPDASIIAIVNAKNEIFFMDQNGKFKTNSIAFKSPITEMVWSNDSSRVLIGTKQSGFTLLQFSNQAITKSAFVLPATDTRAKWDPADNQSILALTSKHELVRYNITTSTSAIIDSNCNTYTFSNNQLIYQRIDNTLVKGSFSQDLNQRALSISASVNGDLAILLESGELLIVDTRNTINSISGHVLSSSWSTDGSLLLLQSSPSELDIYNFSNERMRTLPIHESHVLVRLATTILNPSWFPDNAHIVYQTGSNLILSEVDPRDYVISTKIADLPQQTQNNIWIAKDMNSLIHITQAGNTTNLIRTWLVTKDDR